MPSHAKKPAAPRSSERRAVEHPLHELARRGRLRFACDDKPGIRRVASGRGFRYVDAAQRPVRAAADLERIRALAIPPAWTDVWICPHANGHIQVTGRDAKGRKQYLYHATWQELASRTKFDKLREFGESLPKLRRQVARDLALPGLPRKKVIATVIQLLDRTMLRVGNEEYARANGSHGLTTLRDRHVRVRGAELKFRFEGKSGILHQVGMADRRLAKIVRQCQDLPGQELFQYQGARGVYRRVESSDVNAYLRNVLGQPFTAKDFRTWKATALVWSELQGRLDAALTEREAKRCVTRAIRHAAASLGNTLTVCRKYYVHPDVAELFLEGELAAYCRPPIGKRARGLAAHEQTLLVVLRRVERRQRRPRLAA
jgi:DNA topoisomerase-1